jgi:NAD(P)-dependent dehydrogenase (short-subunit alcohol dehydrogenase family)
VTSDDFERTGAAHQPDGAGAMGAGPGAAAEDDAPPRRRAVLGAVLGAATVGAVGAGTIAGARAPDSAAATDGTSAGTGAAAADAAPGRFRDKVVLITGATSGIGEATARAFAAEGAKVSFCGRRTELGRKVESEIRAAGGDATYLRADVRDQEQVKRFVDNTVHIYGRIDVAFNNAGITRTAPLHELDLETWEDVHRTNARGVFLSIKYQVPHMLRSGGGVIICTSSGSVRPAGTAYTASKHAIDGIIKTAALDYGTQGIRVNAILPGTTDTALVRLEGMSDAQWEEFKEAWGPLNVDGMERLATPEEIARSVLSLAQADAFSFMTGSTVYVAGGPHGGGKMHMPEGYS